MQEELLCFDDLPEIAKGYNGANGGKVCAVFQGEQYMIKFPAPARRNPQLGYTHGCVSEYLGCKIFASTGIATQETLLGTRRKADGTSRIVVACKDFTENNSLTFQDFVALKNTTVFDSAQRGYGVELVEVQEAIDKLSPRLNLPQLSSWFWDMFVVDALIGNWDRHNGNWGFLYDPRTETQKIAPVFDCGSSLYASADEDRMRAILESSAELTAHIEDWPFSALTIDGKHVRYLSFISSLQNQECNRALSRMVPRIDMNRIEMIVDETPGLSNLQRDFYRVMLHARKERILDRSLAKLQEQQKRNEEK